MAVLIPKPMTRDEAGVRREISGGAESLLAALVKRGLDRAHLYAAARLAIELDSRPRP
jgi:hypothetical protein